MTPPTHCVVEYAWLEAKSKHYASIFHGQAVKLVGGVMTPPYSWCNAILR